MAFRQDRELRQGSVRDAAGRRHRRGDEDRTPSEPRNADRKPHQPDVRKPLHERSRPIRQTYPPGTLLHEVQRWYADFRGWQGAPPRGQRQAGAFPEWGTEAEPEQQNQHPPNQVRDWLHRIPDMGNPQETAEIIRKETQTGTEMAAIAVRGRSGDVWSDPPEPHVIHGSFTAFQQLQAEEENLGDILPAEGIAAAGSENMRRKEDTAWFCR